MPSLTKHKKNFVIFGYASGSQKVTILSLGKPFEISGDIFDCHVGDEALLALRILLNNLHCRKH